MSYIIIDTETDILNKYGRPGNPFYNKMVAFGYLIEGLDSQAIKVDYDTFNLFLKDLLDKGIVIVGHNIKFDLLYLWPFESLQSWIKQGGKIWDTQLAEYIITGQQSKYSSLRDLAVNKYKCPIREKLMGPFWEKNITTSDIDFKLVEYDVLQDVRDTNEIYLQQLQDCSLQSQKILIELQMDSLLATTEMEYNGFSINSTILINNKNKLYEHLNNINGLLNKIVAPYLK